MNDEIVIRDFARMVRKQWEVPLSATARLRRRDRKTIRNVIRAYMKGAPPEARTQQTETRLARLLMPIEYATINTFRVAMFGYSGLRDRLEQLGTWETVTTVGRYALYITNRLMVWYNDEGRIVIEAKASSETMRGAMARAFEMLWEEIANIHRKFECVHMFVGTPMYVLNEMDYDVINYRGKMNSLTAEYVPIYKEFYRLTEGGSRYTSRTSHLTMQYMTEGWVFDASAPEFLLEGLAFCVGDRIVKNTYYQVLIYVYDIEGTRYYYDTGSDMQTRYDTGVPVPDVDYRYDASAILIVPPKGAAPVQDPYQDPSKLLTPAGSRDDSEADVYTEVPINNTSLPRLPSSPPPSQEDPSSPEKVGDDGIDDTTIPDDKNKVPPIADEPPYPWSSFSDVVASFFTEMQRVNRVIQSLNSECCKGNRGKVSRLESHIETMRQYSVALSNKTDIQTDVSVAVRPPVHSLTGRTFEESLYPK
ncbi:P4c precursor [Western grey kangaroopox virus]|uniref:P4c n=1 Tax=Western grey kangaroopox virus TaxID=1566307 RepID=A0A2C9DST1_9POXV|nr:P4c precursor [Western grey kangaroopox virus]ATI21064.1 P4c precursor [Western grey kangaroopox virus]